jgi:trans-aconitate methyltransferase
MSRTDSRPSGQPPFGEERYESNDHLFGTEPNAFVASQAYHIPQNGSVVELGAGEGRTLVWLAQERDVQCPAVDFSATALTEASRWANQQDVSIRSVETDVRTWTPKRQWDVVIVVFLQLLPDERPGLYRRIRESLRPGGVVLGQWFRPDHLTEKYDRIGPSSSDRMVPVSEIRDAFTQDEILLCDATDIELAEGPHLRGDAAVARLVARRTQTDA